MSINAPWWYSKVNRMDEQPDHLEPHPMRRIDQTITANSSILEAAAAQRESAIDYKALWLCEVNRGDHEHAEPYSAQELDKAKAGSAFWYRDKCDPLNVGGITMRYES